MTGLPSPGTLRVVGVGPGDPELMTLKAARLIAASPVVAFFAKAGRDGHARRIADPHLTPGAEELRLHYPFTTEVPLTDPHYPAAMAAFYDEAASALAARLEAGRDVALLCEGDPFFYGSAMYLHDRLHPRFPAEVVPGVPGMAGCWARAGAPITHGDDSLAVLPGTLDGPALVRRLRDADAAVVMKLGRNLPKVRAALVEAGMLARALYVERGTMEGERVCPLAELPADAAAPYFSLVLVPGRQRAR